MACGGCITGHGVQGRAIVSLTDRGGSLDQILGWLRGQPSPRVVVTGMPKSGTTVIVKLMGLASGKKAISDPFHALDQRGIRFRDELFSDEIQMSALVRSNPNAFRAVLVKDPNFIHLREQTVAAFPDAAWIFTVRDPRDNIRSILNRLDLPGDSERLLDLPDRIGSTWRRVLEGKTPEVEGANPIETLACRWCLAVDAYQSAEVPMVISRYEEFVAAKEQAIGELCTAVGLEPRNSIGAHVDRQFQPKGNRSVRWSDFFAPRDLQRVAEICEDRMAALGYQTDPSDQ